ncbi:MAG: isoprenyl transferase [Alphaproteobacteria bacterium]|nr:isoprenyl transferase [Alphaproteobacteria bacterium]
MVDVALSPVEAGDGPDRPLHVAIIMDGNGRWARSRGKPRTFGHREGAKAVRRTIEAASDFGVTHLTLFGFSSENWTRPATEIGDIMALVRFYLRRELAELHRSNVRFQVIGDRTQLSDDIVELIENAERTTRNNTGLAVTLALSYGGRAEIAGAARRIAEEAAAGRLKPEAVDETALAARLSTHGCPDPDLVIRTSGEQRLSNFLLWQVAYAEFVFLDVLWPDFDRTHLASALDEFGRRERRYGRALS